MHLADLRKSGEYSGTSLNPDEVESPAEGKVAFNHFRCGIHGASNSSGLIDGLIPAIRSGDLIGLYKMQGPRYRDTSFYDGAMWDDGYNIDLKFVKAIKIIETKS